MPPQNQKQLGIIEHLREKGEFNLAFENLEAISFDKLSPKDQFAYKQLECQLQLDFGELEKAAAIVTELGESHLIKEKSLFNVDLLILQAEIQWRRAKLDDALSTVKEGLKLLKRIKPKQEKEINRRKSALLHHRGVVYWYIGELDLALDCHTQSLEIKEGLGDKSGLASSLNNLGLVFWSKGDINRALEFYHCAVQVNEEIGHKKNLSVALTNIGNCYTRLGDLDKALEFQQQSLEIKEAIGNKHDIAMSLINMGVVYQLKGELNQAQDYYRLSLTLGEETGHELDIAMAVNNMANIFDLKGDLNLALEHFQKSLAIYEKLGIKEQIALLLGNIGGVYRKKGDYPEAQDYYQRSLLLYKEFGNNYMIAVVLSELVWVALEQEDRELVEQSLEQLRDVNRRAKNRIINQRCQLAQALILKSSNRTRQKLKATEILEELVSEEVGDHSVTVTAMIHLCGLLISELKLTGESELISDITRLANQLLEIAKQQSSHSLLAETYLLQSKLALMEMDLGRANKLLTQAQAIAEETGLERLTQTLSEERTLLEVQLQKWDMLVKENPSKQELIKLTKLDDLLERMIQETVTDLMDEKGIMSSHPPKKYQLVYLDLLKDGKQHEKTTFRVGIAQIGLSQSGDILHEFYQEDAPGLFRIRNEKIDSIQATLQHLVKAAAKQDIKILAFPELTIDLNSKTLLDEVVALAKLFNMYIIPGSYHKFETKENISTVISPQGVLWEQAKHIPATIHYQKQRITEGIATETTPAQIIIANTEYGRIAIIICRDFLDMDLRVELKNFEPPIDIIINPAFTPVTADFKATHFDARRSIYAYSFFVNVAEFGDSLIYSPEKDREERTIPPGKEDIIYKDIDLFKLRAARKKWEKEQQKLRAFIQSTR